MYTMIDLFCGTGGFSYGMENSGFEFKLVYGIDADKNCAATARANHPNSRIDCGDIRFIEAERIRYEIAQKSVDVIVGGPPCQGFSSLRPNRGFGIEDERNNLFLHFAKFVDVFKPKVFVLENVVGLLTHKDGSTLKELISIFASLGYSVDWRILNAASFGVPQKRERLIIIGVQGRRIVLFPEPTHKFAGRVIGYKDRSRIIYGNSLDLKPAVTVMEAISDLPELERGESAEAYKSEVSNEYQRVIRNSATVLTHHKAANHSDKMMEVIRQSGSSRAALPDGLVTSGFSSCYSRMNPDEPGNTITVKFQSPASSKCIHPYQNRTITPREAARLQSFPDDFIFSGSLTNIAGQLGNAVPPMLGKSIASILHEIMD